MANTVRKPPSYERCRSVYWDPAIREAMRELARRQRRSLSAEVMKACEEHLRAHGIVVHNASVQVDDTDEEPPQTKPSKERRRG